MFWRDFISSPAVAVEGPAVPETTADDDDVVEAIVADATAVSYLRTAHGSLFFGTSRL